MKLPDAQGPLSKEVNSIAIMAALAKDEVQCSGHKWAWSDGLFNRQDLFPPKITSSLISKSLSPASCWLYGTREENACKQILIDQCTGFHSDKRNVVVRICNKRCSSLLLLCSFRKCYL